MEQKKKTKNKIFGQIKNVQFVLCRWEWIECRIWFIDNINGKWYKTSTSNLWALTSFCFVIIYNIIWGKNPCGCFSANYSAFLDSCFHQQIYQKFDFVVVVHLIFQNQIQCGSKIIAYRPFILYNCHLILKHFQSKWSFGLLMLIPNAHFDLFDFGFRPPYSFRSSNQMY